MEQILKLQIILEKIIFSTLVKMSMKLKELEKKLQVEEEVMLEVDYKNVLMLF